MGKQTIAGTLVLTSAVFDRWQDVKILYGELRECLDILQIRTGLSYEISLEKLTAAHTAWKQECQLWLEHLLPPGTKSLSHLKKAAVLLSKLCEFVPITAHGEGLSSEDKPPEVCIQDGDVTVSLPNQASAEDIRKLRDGGCHYVSWLLTYAVCECFEIARIDRKDAYESRLTPDFETDMVSGLLSGKVSAQAIHLILKALFLRD